MESDPQHPLEDARHRPHRRGPTVAVAVAVALALAAAVALVIGLALPASATAAEEGTESGESGETTTEADDPAAAEAAEAEGAILREGQQVYSQICSACHQPGGTGLSGQFPPLLGNPNVDDSAYVADVVTNGLQGEITVLGETYDGVMPSFSTLSDDEIAAVTAYLQADFDAPATAGDEAAIGNGGPVAGTELPALTNMSHFVALALAAGVILLVLAPRLLSANDRLSVPWLDAWLKTASIVIAVYLLVIYIPNWAMQTDPVAGLSRFGQDLIGTSLWTLGVGILLAGLWYAHRESRV